MVIGVPREHQPHENRVGLTPSAVAQLVARGHTVAVEKGAGAAAHFADRDYEQAGAKIVYTAEEAYKRADLVCRVGPLGAGEIDLLRPGQAICSFHSLAVARHETVERLMALEVTLIGYEIIRDAQGRLPVLVPLSEMAGQLAVHAAARYLQSRDGGRGILLGNVPGVPPPTVLVLGAGTAGSTAAGQALAAGAHVIVVDLDLGKLRRLHHDLGGRVVTALPSPARLGRYASFADVLIGAVLVPGARAPYLVSESMVRRMKQGSVVIDIAIDQGGCVETSRPTTLADPIFIAHGVIHYCVPNMTADVARTSSRALAAACLPYVLELAERGVAGALAASAGLAEGVYIYRGRLVSRAVAEGLGLGAAELGELLRSERGEGRR